MNKQPVYYLQTDARWKNLPYRAKGENTTIGGSGCGPTSAAMLIETITGKTYTPKDACNWSMSHGYKALNQGTYYGYFKPQFAEFGIECEMLNMINTYGKPNHDNHTKAFNLLKKGYYIIACMGPGTWTKSGHFVVVWWEDGKVRINDPASTNNARLNGDPYTFKSQVKYYWWINPASYKGKEPIEEDEDMTQETFNGLMNNYLAELAKKPADWDKDAIQWASENGLLAGDSNGLRPKSYVTRGELATILQREAMKNK